LEKAMTLCTSSIARSINAERDERGSRIAISRIAEKHLMLEDNEFRILRQAQFP